MNAKIRKWTLIVCGGLIGLCVIYLIILRLNPELNDLVPDMERRYWEADTVDEQLRQLNRIANTNDADDQMWTPIERGNDFIHSYIQRPAEPLPEDLTPDYADAEPVNALPESLQGARFLALYQDGSQWDPCLLGDFQIRLPKARRATRLDEVDAVLLLVYSEKSRISEYITTGPGGDAVERVYSIYACERGGKSWLMYRETVSPPTYGRGVLRGDALGLDKLWPHVKDRIRK